MRRLEKDAYEHSWANGLLWINGPFNEMNEIVAKIQADGAQAYVVAPEWPNNTWYDKLQEMSMDSIKVDLEHDTFRPVDTDNERGVGKPPFGVRVWNVDARAKAEALAAVVEAHDPDQPTWKQAMSGPDALARGEASRALAGREWKG